MAIDSHMHINSEVLANIAGYIDDINHNSGIESVINVGLNVDTSKESILISKTNKKFYSTAGIHPLYTESQDVGSIYSLANSDKIVAIGEIGLDHTKNNLLEQKQYLMEQIEIANALSLPVIIHSNNQNKSVIKIFENEIKPKYGCVFHCFQPDIDDLKYLVSQGYYISFAGKITYKTAKKSIEVAKLVPDDLFLVETDSPYISPEPVRDEVNQSSNIQYIIKKIVEVKGLEEKEVDEITTRNTKRLFKKIGNI